VGATRYDPALERLVTGRLPSPAAITGPDGVLVTANFAFAALLDGVSPALLAPPARLDRLVPHLTGPELRHEQTTLAGGLVLHVFTAADEAGAALLEGRFKPRAAGSSTREWSPSGSVPRTQTP
jgi:hypothetical protein